MKQLKITSKTYGNIDIKLDDNDYEKVVSMGKWSVSRDRGKFYFHKRISKDKKITLHRFIMGFPINGYVDHINHDTLDNRKSNLRICSNSDNLRNGLLRSNNTSGYKGISWDKSRKKWTAYIRVNYKQIFLGRYENLEEAIYNRKLAERKYFYTKGEC